MGFEGLITSLERVPGLTDEQKWRAILMLSAKVASGLANPTKAALQEILKSFHGMDVEIPD